MTGKEIIKILENHGWQVLTNSPNMLSDPKIAFIIYLKAMIGAFR